MHYKDKETAKCCIVPIGLPFSWMGNTIDIKEIFKRDLTKPFSPYFLLLILWYLFRFLLRLHFLLRWCFSKPASSAQHWTMSEVAKDTVLYQPDKSRPHSPRINLPGGRRNTTRLSSQSERSFEPSSPSSPPSIRLTRKRAASLNTESANQALVDLSLSSASSTRTLTLDPTREQVCLCQPDPKIPRPRNGAWYNFSLNRLALAPRH